jgi:hypothetical protein
MFDRNCPISIPVQKFLSVSRQVQFKMPAVKARSTVVEIRMLTVLLEQ